MTALTNPEPFSSETAYIGLGSNLGDREAYLREAVLRLNKLPRTAVHACSSIYETAPVGYTEQPHFLNLVAVLRTRLAPEELLNQLLGIEKNLGRTRDIRWGPRTVDLDLLLYGDRMIRTTDLIVPHPRMAERAFVMVPLREVLAAQPLPGILNSGGNRLEGEGELRLWTKTNWPEEFGLSAN